MTAKTKKIMIFAGGTGGHIYPALAIAKALKDKNHKVCWVGTRNKIEADIVPKHGFKISFIKMAGIRKKGFLAFLFMPFMLFFAILQVTREIIKQKPDVLLSMGGFVCAPSGVAAMLTGKKLFIHEQNATAGMSNKFLSIFAYKIFEGYPDTFQNKKAIFTGNPLREVIVSKFKDTRQKSLQNDKLNLLLFGGSQGARALNQVLCATINKKPVILDNFNIKHQSGKNLHNEVITAYKNPQKIEIVPYIDDMSEVLSWADIIICRSGAMSVAECIASQSLCIFVPLPSAVDDHQTKNASFLSQNKAAILLPQSKFKTQKLIEILTKLNKDRNYTENMIKKCYQYANWTATEKIVAELSR
jgi:UDP-N-acetylglucosamine--N-acetylmuramyl-(pentapeptide) pyrophosphoryl-undecaprenol N-acetylglucosamine transferase